MHRAGARGLSLRHIHSPRNAEFSIFGRSLFSSLCCSAAAGNTATAELVTILLFPPFISACFGAVWRAKRAAAAASQGFHNFISFISELRYHYILTHNYSIVHSTPSFLSNLLWHRAVRGLSTIL